MKISEFIEKLNKTKEEFGDLEVVCASDGEGNHLSKFGGFGMLTDSEFDGEDDDDDEDEDSEKPLGPLPIVTKICIYPA